MPNIQEGGSSASQGLPISLDAPLSSGDAYANLATNAKGKVIGEPAAPVNLLNKDGYLTQESIDSIMSSSDIAKLSASTNIALQWNGASSTVVLNSQLKSVDPTNPTVPIIAQYYDLAKSSPSTNSQLASTGLSTGNAAGVSSSSGVKSAGNPWLAGNVMVTFLITFMNLVTTLMKMKMTEGKIQIAGMNLTVELAKNAAKFIMSAAQAQSFQHVMGAVCAGVSMVTTIGCTAGSFAAKMKMGSTEEEEFVPAKATDPEEETPTNADSANINDEGEAGEEEESVSAVTNNKQTSATIKSEEAEGDVSGEGADDDIQVKQKDAAKAGIDDAKEEADTNQKVGDKQAAAKSDKTEEDEDTTEIKENEKSADEKNKERQQIKQRNRDIRARNRATEFKNRQLETKAMFLQGFQGAMQSGMNVVSEGVAANVALVAGQANANKEVIDGIKAVIASAYMHNMSDAFKSNTDLISQVLSTYDSIHQRLADAVAAALRH